MWCQVLKAETAVLLASFDPQGVVRRDTPYKLAMLVRRVWQNASALVCFRFALFDKNFAP